MSESPQNKELIKDYLLGKISDEETLAGLEESLFTDDEFAENAALVEDEIINDYVLGNLNKNEREFADKYFFNSTDRQFKLKLTQELKAKADQIKPEIKEEKPSFFESLAAFFRQPLSVGTFAVLLIAAIGLSIFFLSKPESTELAQLQTVYQKERPVETRISGFDYAPLVVVRGAENQTDEQKRKLRLIETKLLEAVENNPNAFNHHALGIFYLTQTKYADALKELEKAVGLDNKNSKFHNDLGSAYFETAKNGDKDKKLENLARANESFSQALELDANLLEALFNKSLVLQELNLPRQAKESWELYLQKDSASKWADEARKNLANLSQSLSRFKTRDQILNDFLTAFRNKDETLARKIHNETKGNLANYSVPCQLARRYLQARRARNDTEAQETITALKEIGNYEQKTFADFFVAETARFYETISAEKIDKLLEAHELFESGFEGIKEYNYARVITKFEQSRDLFRQLGNETEASMAEIWAAEFLPDVSHIEEGKRRLQEIIAFARKRNFKVLLPTAYYWLSICNYRQGELSNSIKYNKQALKVAEETSNFLEIEHCGEGLASGYFDYGELDKSLFYTNSLIVNNNAYFQNKANFWRNIGHLAELAQKLGFYSTSFSFAKENYEVAKEFLPDNNLVNSALKYMAQAVAEKGNFPEALKYAAESNQIALSRGESAENIQAIAETYLLSANLKNREGNFAEALPDYEKALAHYQKIPEYTVALYEIHRGKLFCLYKLNRQSEFDKELQTVLNLSEQYRAKIREDESRQAFFDNEQIVFDVAVENALKQKDSRQAFELAEISRARSLLDFVQSKKSINELERDFSSVSKPLNLTEIQARMPENVQIVKYAWLTNKLAIWILTKNRFELIEKDLSTDELAEKINDYRQAILAKENSENLKKTAQELSEILLPKNLENEKTLCLIPDKLLYNIPFASLVLTDGKYLIEDFALFYAPSAPVMVLASENAEAKQKVSAESLLSVGNPAFDREENPALADLPTAETEAKKIAEFYPKTQKFIGEEATKQSFLNNLDKSEVIHFAGHFIVNGNSSGNSKLLFAGEDLRSFELGERKIPKSKLVVLSACETGFERFNRSEGAIGIARTFLAMGTPAVVASNWKVDSEATKNLMIAFHRKRRLDSLSSVEALRQSQLEMLKSNSLSSPFYWSAFGLTGGFVNF